MTAPASSAPTVLAIHHMEDAAVVRAVVRRLMLGAGFDRRAAEETAIGASELATNLVKHAGGGELELSRVDEGVVVLSRDRGPGPPSRGELLSDGRSRGAARTPDQPISSGLGSGGGALARFFDQVEIAPRDGGGTEIRCTRRHERARRRPHEQ
jgi:serine/threonine-protein kinase RsbT